MEPVIIVAHRGASRDAPENTLPAFELAWAKGADAIEGDFRLTKDGHIVCIHDRDTKRVSGKRLVIKESTLAALRALEVGLYRGKKYKGTFIPTIEEVFSTIPAGKIIYIEIKSEGAIVPRLFEEINRSGLQREQIVVISLNENVIRECKTKGLQSKAFWVCEFQKDQSGEITPSLATTLETLQKIKADGLSSNKGVINESFARNIMEHGYEFHVWAVDELEMARQYIKWGARSITTNVPGFMKKNLGRS
ncbi:MAG: glycerophosphodiester phosphodiesterase [Deltaproteobacteria bacterium]|nr:glycerophosphodiester phosphodiesterase [Deltaproteobacteria bacterium]